MMAGRMTGIVRLMKTLRIALGILLVIPLGLLTYRIFFVPVMHEPNALNEMAFLVLGVPILVFNYWIWFEPGMVEYSLWGRR